MDPKSEASEAATGSPRSVRGATILVVEDSPVQAELLRRVFEGAGYQVITAADGAEGLALTKANHPAAVVSDINMPIMDGYALCRAIRGEAALKFTPVVLLTMLSDPLDVIRGLNAGADAYVTKPYNAANLVSRVESLLAYPPVPPPPGERRKVEIRLGGKTHLVDAHSPRMLNLLLSTYENAVMQNRELVATQQALEDLNQNLDQKVLEKIAEIQESERRFRGLLEAAPDAMVVVNQVGDIVLLNVQAEKQFGYRRDELLGQKVKNIIPEGFAERLVADSLRSVAEVLAQQIGTGIELTARRKDGSEFPIELMLSPLESAEGILVTAAIRDISKREAAEAKIIEVARTDVLTTLPNRMAFIEQLGMAFATAKRGGTPLALLFLDLDSFKDINDTLGHPMGDKLLKLVAERLRHDVRASDFVARLGGDEFAILQGGAADPADAGILAAKICKDLKSPCQLEGNTIRITVSIGICIFDAGLAEPVDMLTQADLALYRAKEAGRDRFTFHSEDLDRIVQERVSITEDLRAALERGGELEVYYQPQVEMVSGRIVGVEALVRWNHPKRGQIMPSDFIEIAEKTGGITALGHWVLDESCRQMSRWCNEGIAPPVIAVNVSAVQLKTNLAFDKEIAGILAKWGLRPSELELELTESVLMETTQERRGLLEHIRQSGVRISIDDFGTGYSSFNYLRNYQINRLKIAQQFIFGLPGDSGDIAITRATLSLAGEFRIEVIAEGVETAEQAAFLVSLGCKYAQGYYFSRPVPADSVTLLLRQGRIDVGTSPVQ
jgi:diguanylate cyclase (GGDEF)-like protein/PAS domain S-box-containing protein